MAKDQVRTSTTRSGARAAGAAKPPVVAASAAPAEPKKRTNPAQFVNEVRAETRRITWPTWRETWIASIQVLILVAVTAVFFLVVDGAFSFLLQQLLRLASS